MTEDERMPRYRLLTGPDDASFCRRVSEALELGYSLYGSPAITSVDGRPHVAQAVLWGTHGPTPPVGAKPSTPGQERA